MDFLEQMEALNRPTVEIKPWMRGVNMILATEDMLDQIAEECIAEGHYGLDLETTGLDQRAFPDSTGRLVTVDKIVGYCVAPYTDKGYYIPVRHREKGASANVPPRKVAEMMRKILKAGAVAVLHNSKFDTKFLAHEPAGDMGTWDEPGQFEDTLILAYLENSRQRNKGLKYLAKSLLNREMIELGELFLREKGQKKGNFDFSTLDPTWEPVIWYAAADAINTLAIFKILHPKVIEKDDFGYSQKTVYLIEKICVIATRWMEQCRIHIDREKLKELIQKGQKEWWDSITGVYKEVSEVLGRDVRPAWVGNMESSFDPMSLTPHYMEAREVAMKNSPPETRVGVKRSVPKLTDPKIRETVDFPPSYDVTIPHEFGLMLRELGVSGLTATEKSGQIKTSKDEIERVVQESGDKFPWMVNVKRFREIAKALSNVLFNVWWDSTPERSPDGCVWASFNGLKVDTGRFSTPTPRGRSFHGQVNWNVQSTKAYYYDPKNPPPECVYRQREIVAARPGHTLFAIDFSGVELRIVTNLAMEMKWVKEFFRCSTCDNEFERGERPPAFCPECGSDKIGDLHSLTATSIFSEADPKGDPKKFKLLRQTAKIVNFLLCYGGSGNAVCRSTGCDEEEGWRIKNQFDKSYRGLLKWWRLQEKTAMKQKYVTTAFGRKYPVPDIDHEFSKFRSKAKRNAVNGPVQGSSADIMKLAMGLLYREFRRRGWLNKVLMTITIHDELVFEIANEVMGEAVPVIENIMCIDTVKNLNWLIPLKVDTEFGPNWTVPYNLTEMEWNQGGGDWTPELAAFFPEKYARYLSCGGTPVGVEVEAPPEEAPAPAPAPVPSAAPAAPSPAAPQPQVSAAPTPAPAPAMQVAPTLKQGDTHVFRISSNRLTASLAHKLSKVLYKCRGRGTDSMLIQDENGNDLLGGTIQVAWDEFKLLAAYEGI